MKSVIILSAVVLNTTYSLTVYNSDSESYTVSSYLFYIFKFNKDQVNYVYGINENNSATDLISPKYADKNS